MLLMLLVATLAHAPAQETKAPPSGWHVRVDGEAASGTTSGGHDHAGAAGVAFVDMPPGWHITTGPSVILYHPDRTASGRYAISSESFLFDPGTRREGYGLFFGGRDLDGAGQRYTYFLIRRTGEFLIKRRNGSAVSTVRDWTAHPAILAYDKRGDAQTAKNVLGVDVTASDVVFRVNDAEVARVPRTEIDTDGVVGLRVNHHLNLHVSSLEITPAR